MRLRHRISLATGVYASHVALSLVSLSALVVGVGAERAQVGYELSNFRLDYIDAISINLGSNLTSFAVRNVAYATLMMIAASTVLYLIGRGGSRRSLTALGAFVAAAFLINLPYVLVAAVQGIANKEHESLSSLMTALAKGPFSMPIDMLARPFLSSFTWTFGYDGVQVFLSLLGNVLGASSLVLAVYLVVTGIHRGRADPAPVLNP